MSNDKARYKELLEDVVCNQCGTNDFDVIYPPQYEDARPDHITESFRSSGDEILVDQLVMCRQCGLQYLTPRLRQDIVIDGYSEGTDETFVSQVAGRERTFAGCLDLIEKYVPDRGKILDIGTASGSFLGVAQQRGWDVQGCEPNRWLAEWGKQHYNITIHPGTLFDMDFPDESFDVVTLWDVLEHTPDPRNVLQECFRILKKDGLVVVNYPDIHSSIARLMGRKWVFLLSVHLYYFTLKSIINMLEDAGFSVGSQRKHWQSLELGYILFRMKPYLSFISTVGTKIIQTLRMDKIQIPYWMGQMLVLAHRSNAKRK